MNIIINLLKQLLISVENFWISDDLLQSFEKRLMGYFGFEKLLNLRSHKIKKFKEMKEKL